MRVAIGVKTDPTYDFALSLAMSSFGSILALRSKCNMKLHQSIDDNWSTKKFPRETLRFDR